MPAATDTPLPAPTDTPLPTATNTALPTATWTPLPTWTNTPLPTATDTPLPTATDTPPATMTDTPTPTPTSSCWGDTWPDPRLNFGPPDGLFFTLGCSQSLIIDLGGSPIVTQPGYDFVYYERYAASAGGIYLDSVVIEVCTDASCSVSYQVFNWGDAVIDLNTNIGVLGYSPGEPDNDPIPEADLYGTPPLQVGITIDVDAVAPSGTYQYIRLSAPGGSQPDGAEIDAIEAL